MPAPLTPGPMYWKKSVSLCRRSRARSTGRPCPCPAGRCPRRWRRRRGRTRDVAVAEDVRVGDRSAVVLGAAVEQGAGDLGGGAAGLGRPVVELGDLEVAVAVDARSWRREVPTCDLERPVVVEDAPDPLVVAEDQPRQAGGRVDHRDDAVVVGPAHVERDPRDAGAVVGEAGVVVDVQGRVGQERVIRVADEVEVRGGIVEAEGW